MPTENIALANNAGAAIGNATIPAEGPKCIPVLLDFTTQPAWKVDPLALYQQQTISLIQCVYIDNAFNGSPTTLDIPGTSQTVIAPPFSQGYYPILSPKAGTLNFSSPGNIAVKVELINVPLPASVWFPNATAAEAGRYTNGGALVTEDDKLAPIIDPAKGLLVQGIAGGGGGHASDCFWQTKTQGGGANYGPTTDDNNPSYITRAEVLMTPDAYAGAAGVQDIVLHVLQSTGYVQGIGGVYLPAAAPAQPASGNIVAFRYDGLLNVKKDWLHPGIAFSLPQLNGGFFYVNFYGYTVYP